MLYGSDYMMTQPQDFADAIRSCLNEQGEFDFTNWGDKFKSAIDPLWLLKYLPNLPAAHIAIFNDLHGPNNSLTMREASSNMAVSEAYQTISRGHADVMVEARERAGAQPTYISFDIDVLDPSMAPGTGTPEIGGVFTRDAQAMVRALAGIDIAGADVVEVSPPFDVGGMTALAGATMMFELLCVTAASLFARAA